MSKILKKVQILKKVKKVTPERANNQMIQGKMSQMEMIEVHKMEKERKNLAKWAETKIVQKCGEMGRILVMDGGEVLRRRKRRMDNAGVALTFL